MSTQAAELQVEGVRLDEFYRYIEAAEYDIRWQDAAGTIQAPNRAKNLRVSFYHDGFSAIPRKLDEGQTEWSLSILLDQVGRQDQGVRPVEREAQWSVTQGQARQRLGDVLVEYENSPKGLKQTFLLESSPTGRGPVQLTLAVTATGLQPTVSEDAGAIRFTDPTTDGGLIYNELHVWDSRGQSLPASFVQIGENTFAIQVDDSGATYPVTVDPTLSLWGTYDVNQSGAKLGSAIAETGPVSNSTSLGVLVGAPYYDDGQTDEGKVFLFDLTSYSNTPVWTAQVDQANAHFGSALASNFNVDGDSFMDVALSAPDWDESSQNSRGKVWVWKGGSSGLAGGSNGTTGNAFWSKLGLYGGDLFGTSLAVGEVTALGSGSGPDLIVGAPGSDDAYPPYATDVGLVAVFSGTGSTFPSTISWYGYGDYYSTYYMGTYIYTGSQLGQCVAVVGDLNADGYQDIAVGAPYSSYYGTVSGRLRTYLGASGSPSASTSIYAGVSGAKFGWSIAGADLDGDGYSDVVVGAPFDTNGQTQEGIVHGYQGGSGGLSSSAHWTWEKNEANSRFGWSVTVGDANGNNTQDVIIGAPYYDNPIGPISNAGCATFYFLNGDGTAASSTTYFDLNGAADEYFGTTVRVLGSGSQKTAIAAPGASTGGDVLVLSGSGS